MHINAHQQGTTLAITLLLLNILSLLIISSFEVALLNQKALNNHYQQLRQRRANYHTLGCIESWLTKQITPPESLPKMFLPASIKLVDFIEYPFATTADQGIYFYQITVPSKESPEHKLTATYFMRFDQETYSLLPAYIGQFGRHNALSYIN